MNHSLVHSPLGKDTTYKNQYDPSLLFPILRKTNRDAIGIPTALPFKGCDIWNIYELSWLNLNGKPQIALAEIYVPAESPYIFESKSLKLYIVSFNQTKLASTADLQQQLQIDLNKATQSQVAIKLMMPQQFNQINFGEINGICLDDLDINCQQYLPDPSLLQTESQIVHETVYSHLLKSNCPITGQPDWGSIQIKYTGAKINHASLLKYIISFRQNNEFHEHCVERIYMDIWRHCKPQKLSIYARYTRRGGIDINPFRSNFQDMPDSLNVRSWRQ